MKNTMKKIVVWLVLVLMVMSFSFMAGATDSCDHTDWFRDYGNLRSEATCKEPATYWLVCRICGEQTDEYRTYGSPSDHIDRNFDGVCDTEGCEETVDIPENVADGKLTAGDNLTWNYDESTATLTISGNGPMYDFSWVYYDVPWENLQRPIKNIVIENGVTTIGSAAFANYDRFDNPYSYTVTISIPDTVTKIGSSAFAYSYIEEITLPKSIEVLEFGAFRSSNIKSIHIPENLSRIEGSVFSGCEELERITVDENNPYYYADENGILFNKAKTEIIKYPARLAFDSYTIPNTVETISNAAFDCCKNLKNIVITDSVVSIGSSAFEYCENIATFSLPDSVKKVGAFAFHYSGYYGNESNWVNGILCIDHCLIKVDYDATEVTIPDNITVLAEWSFSRSDITEITIPGRIEVVTSYAFYDTDALKKVIIEDGVRIIEDNVFGGCDNLSEIQLPDSIEEIGDGAFRGTAYYKDERNWQNGLLIMSNCIVGIKPNSTEVNIDKNIKYIDLSIFEEEALVEKITVDKDNSYYSSDEHGVLYNKDKTKLLSYPFMLKNTEYAVPETVKEINYIFSVYLESLTLHENVEKIEKVAILKLKDVYIETDSIIIGANCELCYSTIDWSNPSAEELFNEYIELYNKAMQGTASDEELLRAQKIMAEIVLDDMMPYGTIHANFGSNAHKYALENGIPFKNISELEEPHSCTYSEWFTETEPTVFSEGVSKRVCECGEFETKPIAKLQSAVTKDETTKVEITYTEENFESEVEVIVSEESINANIVFGDYENIKAYDISLTVDGESVQPNGYVTVKLPLPEGFNAETTEVYYVAPDGTKTKLDSTVENGYVVFETNHFSEYVLVDESSKIEPPHEHSYTASITKTATCTESGTKTYTCSCGDTYTETVLATGHDFDGSACKNCDFDKASDCSCNCHKGGIMGFFWKIINFFNKLFKSKQLCACGAKHW